ncbi:MAG: peroxide stress protein YaaA [Bacteroidales bacterium]|nr:peroxide stress protein YaaA [Bacteroidales bacterium]
MISIIASNEYFKAIKPNTIKGEIITPIFKEAKGNGYKVITVYAKTARGLMSRFIIQNRIENPEDVKALDTDGYLFNRDLSTEKEWVYTR